MSGTRGWSPRCVTWLGLCVNALLSAGKVGAGLVFGSQAILTDGLHSASDLVTDFAVLWVLWVSERPADDDHHFGHLRAATLVALFVGAMLLLAAIWIAGQALWTLRERHAEVRPLVPLVWAVASVLLKEWLFRLTRAVGHRVRDPSIVANAWHHRTDAFTSVAAAAGLLGIMVGGVEWAFLDHVTAVGLAVYLGYVAVNIVRSSASELMDRAPDPRTMAFIEGLVASTPGVRSYHAVRARRLGGRVSMDLHIHVDPSLTVRQGHDIATKVERRIHQASLGVAHVVVHVETRLEPSGRPRMVLLGTTLIPCPSGGSLVEAANGGWW